MRKGFTLIEMMIAIAIFSLIVIFLYQSYASLNRSNLKYNQELEKLKKTQQLKQVFYLDFSLALDSNITILNQDSKTDVVFLHSSNSLHHRFDPYIAYIVKEGQLYRMESLHKFVDYPLAADSVGDVDPLGKVDHFRVYRALKKDGDNIEAYYLIDFRNDDQQILYKIKGLNQ